MECPQRGSPAGTGRFQYAVPVTIESFSKGFVAHKFLISRHYIPHMRMFHRALYTIEHPHSSSRRIKRQLPLEIIDIITQYVKAAAVEQGFSDCEKQIGVSDPSTYLELEEGLRRLERWGCSRKGPITWPAEDTLSKFMMERYSLSIMPGMWDVERRGRLLTHLFLCYSPSELPHPFTIKAWNPSEHTHPALSKGNFKNAQCAPRTTVSTWLGYWGRHESVSRTCILERAFVRKTLESDSVVGRVVREMRLDVVALGKIYCNCEHGDWR